MADTKDKDFFNIGPIRFSARYFGPQPILSLRAGGGIDPADQNAGDAVTPTNPTPAMTTADWIKLVLVLAPTVAPLVKDAIAIFKSHPELKPEDLTSFVAMIHSGGDDLAAFIAADKAAQAQKT